VNLADNWSKPRAVSPFSGQSTKKAETGGWWDVCSVRYETLTFFPDLGVATASKLVILGMLDEDACLDPVGVCFPDLIEEAALPFIDAALIAEIAGALSSTSQLH
jgi:hypothetical protein